MATTPPNSHTLVSIQDLRTALLIYGGQAGRAVANNPEALAIAFEFLKAANESSRSGMISSAMSFGNQIILYVNLGQGAQIASKSTTFLLNQAAITLSAAKILKLSPAATMLAAGSILLQKTGAIGVMIPASKHNTQCVLALVNLAGSIGITAAVGIPTGGLAATLTLASLAAAGISAAASCRVSP